jgi:hypothetical protein
VLSQKEFEIYDDELNLILKEFYTATFKIINIAISIDPKNHYISWVRQQIDLVRKIDKENIIKRVHDKFWFYRKEIIDRDTEFFNRAEFSRFIKKDENEKFMYSFVNMIRKKISDLTDEQKDIIWYHLEAMLTTTVRYKKLIGDYS